MGFKGLEDRFNAKMDGLYDHGSTRDGGSRAGRNDEPYLEFKPNDPKRNETRYDSWTLPVGSIKRDTIRLGKFLISNRGLLFLGKEALLQTGNAFTETRIINPLFVIANVQPYKHFGRSLTSAKDFGVTGDQSKKSPASDTMIGASGRLQRHTGATAMTHAVGSSVTSGMFTILTRSKLTSLLTSTFSVGKSGSYGVNQRPELDVRGEYYAILLWKGFVKQQSAISNLTQARANLRVGNIKGAVNNIKSVFKKVKAVVSDPIRSVQTGVVGATPAAGSRYFILDDKAVRRYLKNSMVEGETGPEASLSFLNHRPTDISTNRPTPPTSFTIPLTSEALREKALIQKTKSVFSQIKTGIDLFTKKHTSLGSFITKLAGVQTTQNKTVEDDVLEFPTTSMRSKYEDKDTTFDKNVTYIKDILEAQKERQFAYWDTRKNITGVEYSGVYIGTDIDPSLGLSPVGRYITDRMNTQAIFNNSTSATSTLPTTLKDIEANGGRDLIDVQWFDFVNKKTIPFRAYISSIVEAVIPETADTRYIGRIERNIVYAGVSRELTMQLKIHAMSDAELTVIWEKINYMTGLCYPSTYSSGFMVPPFVKLTIGDVYRDQPGYIRSLSHTIEDDVSWEITPGFQAPHGITMNIVFSAIEKSQMSTRSTFYKLGSRGVK